MLKLDDLALQPDVELGPMLVSPSRRKFSGPGGEAHLEPLVVQVFLLLLEAGGKVITRNQLFDQCWGGVMVGDDSLNRAILKLRRAGSKAAPGLFEVETIPRTGYRLTGQILEFLNGVQPDAQLETNHRPVSRRAAIAGGAAVLAIGATAGWLFIDRPHDPGFAEAMRRGEDALRVDDPGAARYFEKAIALDPNDARAWGLLAFARASENGDGTHSISGQAAQSAEQAAKRALDLKPNEPNALLAMTIMQSDMLDWLTRERSFRRVLAIDPRNTLAMRNLGQLLHSVGRCRDALAMADRALAIEPLSPDHQFRKALRLWTLGRVAESDQVCNRAMELWPAYPLARLVRLMIYAFTGRTDAALAIVDDEEKHPHLLSPEAAAVWRSSLAALANPTAATVAAARKANVEGSKRTPAIAATAILVLSALGELDSAFEVANGFLLGSGSLVVRPREDHRNSAVNGPRWRNTLGLFTPPTKAMRLDPRFQPLSDGLGLTDYWQKGKVGPDAFLFSA